MEKPVLVFLALLPGIFAGALDRKYNDGRGDSSCATRCTDSQNFKYKIGKTYRYKYEVATSTSLNGAGKGASQIQMEAIANIHILSKCEMALTLSDTVLKISEPDSNQLHTSDEWQLKSELEFGALRFSFQDGKIENICQAEDETIRSLNLKRGLLSAFQNSMSQHDTEENTFETDIAGMCPTKYSVIQKRNKFTKVKDLLGCSDRHKFKTFVHSTPFRMPNIIQSVPLLKGDHQCDQIISRDGHLSSSICKESLIFRPFSRHDAGVGTRTIQTLTYKYVTNMDVKTGPVSGLRSTLLFVNEEISSNQGLWAARDTLTNLCRITVETIPASVPGLFTDMVYQLRGLEAEHLKELADRIQRGDICNNNKNKAKKFFMDALPMMGTSASVEVMVDYLLSGAVTGQEADMWIVSLNFVHEPTLSMISQGKKLLQSKSLRKDSLLPVSSLVNSYCKTHNCEGVREVSGVASAFSDILSGDCQKHEDELVLLTLRAVGNMGYARYINPSLTRCVKAPDNSMIIRVLAVDAFRSVPCDENRQPLMTIFMNKAEDSELRIAAYLTLMKCPSDVILSEVRKALENESVNQVGSFVWTHLTNLMHTSSPQKQGIRAILENEELKKEFDMDKRKYSRNYEMSIFSEKFGMGAMAESNIVFSSSSFLPRSAMLNLTVDMFGQSVNLLEVGGRVQGLEMILQKYLGSSMFADKAKQNKDSPSRCISKQKMKRMKEQFEKPSHDLSASFYFKMFGNELGFKHFTEKEIQSFKDKFNFNTIIGNLAKGQDISFTKSALFADSSVTVPTISGMALHLSINGSSTVELITKGKIDMRRIKSHQKMEAVLNFRPSAAVKVSGLMSVTAGSAQVGLRHSTTLHTNTAITGSVDLTNGQVLAVDFDTPVDKMDLLEIKSEFFLVHNYAEKKMEMTQNNIFSEQKCSPKEMLKVTGFQICSDVSFMQPTYSETSPHFPLTGPITISLALHKKDAPRGYKLSAKKILDKDTSQIQLNVNTPGSTVDRTVRIGYFVDRKTNSLEAELVTPWTNLLAKGSFKSKKNSYAFNGLFRDRDREYKVNTTLDATMKGAKTIWLLRHEFQRPEHSAILTDKFLEGIPEKFTIGGTFEVDKKWLDIDVDLTYRANKGPDPIKFKGKYINKENLKTLFGSVEMSKKVYSGNIVLKGNLNGKKGGKLEPTVMFSSPGWRIFLLSGKVDYRTNKNIKGKLQINMDKTLKSPAVLVFRLSKQGKKAVNRFRGMGKLTSSFANMNIRGLITSPSTGFLISKIPITSKINFDYKIDLIKNKAYKRNQVTFVSKILSKSTKAEKKMDIAIDMVSKKIPAASFKANAVFSHKPTLSEALLKLRHGKFVDDKTKEIVIGGNIKHDRKPRSVELAYNLQFVHPLKALEYEAQGKHKHTLGKTFSFETYSNVIYAKRKNIEFRLQGTNSNTKANIDAHGTIELIHPSMEIGGKTLKAGKYKISSNLQQKSKKDEYLHTVSIQLKDKKKHSIVSTFKPMKNNNFKFYSETKINGNNPATFTLDMRKNKDTIKSSFDFECKNNKHEVQITFENKQNNMFNFNSTYDMLFHQRKVKGSIEIGHKSEDTVVTKIITAWDADRNPDHMTYFFFSDTSMKNSSYEKRESKYLVTTPWEGHKIYESHTLNELINEPKKMYGTFKQKYIWGTRKNEWSYSGYYNPYSGTSPEKRGIKFAVITPFKQLNKASVEIKLSDDSSNYLSTTINTVLNEDNLDMSFFYSKRGNKNKTFKLKISSSAMRNSELSFQLIDNGKKFSCQATVSLHQKQYSVQFISPYKLTYPTWQIEPRIEIYLPNENPLIVIMDIDLKDVGKYEKLRNISFSLQWKPMYNTDIKTGLWYSEKSYDYDVLLDFEKLPSNSLKSIKYHKHTDGYSGSSFLQLNNDREKTYKTKYSFSKTKSEIEHLGGNYESFLVNAVYGKYPYTVNMQIVWPSRGSTEKIVVDASINENSNNGWIMTSKISTPFHKAKSINIRSKIKKSSESDWDFDSDITIGVREKITVSGTLDVKKGERISAEIQTPYKEMSSFKYHYNRTEKANLYTVMSDMEIQPYIKQSKSEFIMNTKTSEAQFKFRIDVPDHEIKFLELNFNHVGTKRGLQSNFKVNYHPRKEIDLLFNSKFDKINFPDNTKASIDLKTPYKMLPSLNLKASIDKKANKYVSLVDLKTASKDIEFIKMKTEHVITDDLCYNDMTVESSMLDTITAGLKLDWGDMAGLNVTLDAPVIGRSVVGFKKNSKSWTDFQNKVFVDINGMEVDLDIGLKHDAEESNAWLTYIHPSAENSYIKSSVHRVGHIGSDFDVGGFLQIGRNAKPFNVSVQYTNLPNKVTLGTTFETPFSDSLSYLISGENHENAGHKTKIYTKYGTYFFFDTMSNLQYQDSSAVFETSTTYKQGNIDHRNGMKLRADWTLNENNILIESNSNENWVKAEFAHKRAIANNGIESIDLSIHTPYDGYKDFGLQASLTNKKNKYQGKCTLEYTDDREAILVFEMNKLSKSKRTINAELSLPIKDYEKNTLTYTQVLKKDRISGNIAIVTGKFKRISGNFQFNNKKKDYRINISGPVQEFHSMSVVGKFDEKQQKLEGVMNLRLSKNPKPIILDFDAHIGNDPINIAFKLKSPYEEIKQVDVEIKHWGREWKQFRTMANVNSNKIGKVLSETNFKFVSISDMKMSSSLSSSIKNFENCRLVVEQKQSGNDRSSHIEVGWSKDQEITTDLDWTYSKSLWNNQADMNLMIRSTLEQIKKADVSLSHSHGNKQIQDKVKVRVNGKTHLDADINYNHGNRHIGNIYIKAPHAMSIEFSGVVETGLFDGKIKFNWDKNNPEGHINIQALYADKSQRSNIDKSLKFKVFNPARIMGLDYSLKQSDTELLSAGSVTWDQQEGKTILYNIGWNNRTSQYSKMFEHQIKVGIPHRSIKITNTFSDQGTANTLKSALFWDADKDESKKIALTTTMESKDKTKRVGLNLNLPSINKQLNLVVGHKEGYPNSLLDTKAELSYSSDPRKTITLTTKITNLDHPSTKSYNYSVEVGFRHPVTDVAIQTQSYFGSSEKMFGVGHQLLYKTVNKETKTLKFSGHLDENSIEVQFINPISAMGFTGQRETRRGRERVVLRSFENNKQAMRLDVEVNPKTRTMELDFTYDPENPRKMLSLKSHYVNDSAINLSLKSHDPQVEEQVAMALRLNSSNVMHSRITWNPSILQNFQKYVSTKITTFQYKATTTLDEAVNKLGAEVKAKYVLISSEVSDELSEVFTLMEREMSALNSQLHSLSTEIRRAYRRNDLYIKDMGHLIKAAFGKFINEMTSSLANYRLLYQKAIDATQDWLADLSNYPIAQRYTKAIRKFLVALMDIRSALEGAFLNIAAGLEKLSEESYKLYVKLSRQIDRKLDSYKRFVKELPARQQILAQEMEEAKRGGHLATNIAHLYSIVYFKVQKYLQEQWHDVMARPEFEHTHAIGHEFYTQFQNWYEERSFSHAVKRTIDMTKNLLLMQLKYMKDVLMDYGKTKIIIFDPERGEMQLEVHWPFGIKSLTEKPKISLSKFVREFKSWTQMDLPLPDGTFIETAYDYIPPLEPSQWFPPFQASGYLLGSQHYLTFDKHNYDFMSECSHVLARDVMNDTFSIVVNYNKNPEIYGIKSFCFTIENSITFEISKEYKLTIKGQGSKRQEAELPYISERVSILRERDLVRVVYDNRMTSILNPKLDLYKVSISGSYFGQVAGMFGEYDYEPGTDHMMSRHKDLEVGRKSCTSKNLAITQNAIDYNWHCTEFFQSMRSMYKPCFKQVDPTEFLKLCQVYMGKMEENEALHKITEQYRFICEDQGIFLAPVQKVAECKGEEFQISLHDPNYQSADVLFVVEDSDCNSWAANSLTTIVTQVNQALETRGLKSNRFGLIGYGNVATHSSTIRTIGGKMFGMASHFNKAAKTLQLKKSSAQPNIYEALQMATKYPYRPGVAKVLVVAPCSTCTVGILERHMAESLRSQAFMVHVLQDKGFHVSHHQSDNMPKVYGLDNYQTFTNYVSDIRLNPKEVDWEKGEDYCSSIAKVTYGSVFDTRHLTSSLDHKKFIEAFAHKVLRNTALPECQQCACNRDGNIQCHLCDDLLNISKYFADTFKHLPSLSMSPNNYEKR